MIRQIIYREVLENILSLRFVMSLILTILLFAAAGFVFVAKYKQESQDYWKNTNENLSNLNEQTKQLHSVARYRQTIYRKPKLLALCNEGFEKYLPNSFQFSVFSTYIPEVRSLSNFDLGRFSDMDLAFIISMILSFMALIFAYDTISGEKEKGTLRLILTASIPRHTIILGKYAGVMLTLGIPLLLGLLVNLLIVVSSGEVVISVAQWFKILTIVLLSFLYLSIFVLLGIFVSSRTSHSANSMVILLLVWIGLVILIPSFGRIISDAARKSPTQAQLQRKFTEADRQIRDACNSGKFGRNAGMFSQNPEKDNPPGTVRFYNAWREAYNQVREDHLNKMIAPATFGRSFTRLSPAVVYQCASEVIAGTGINRFKSLYQQVKRYQAELKEYVRSKDAEDPDSIHLLCDHGQAIRDWGVMSKKPVSFDTVPKFQERDLALGQSLKLAIWDIGLLVLFNLVFFAAAFVSFLRYDVR